jgi:flagellar motility protein MotE (MotC chaperone)
MKKILSSIWFVALLALVLGLGTQAVVFIVRLNRLEEAMAAAPVVDEFAVPETIAWSFLTPDIEQMRAELALRLETIGLREKELDDYELRLRAERAELQKLARDLEQMRLQIGTSITEVQASEQKNLKTLATTYTNVSPAAALAIFREMDDEMVVKILAFMKPDPVGRILEEMAQTKDGAGTLAGRAAVISNKLRLLRQVRAEETP